MNNLYLSCFFAIVSFMMPVAQVPQAMKYQAVRWDSTGSILANANVTLRVSIIDSAAGGSV